MLLVPRGTVQSGLEVEVQTQLKSSTQKQGLPEQFGAFDYFDIGNTAGGAITGIAPYYNNLIIFRQRAIDIVRIGNGGQYQVSQLNPEIGTTAVNTAKLVPGVGLMFLGYDGIYAISGGLDGGSAVSVQRISAGLAKEIPLISRAALPRATAVYSAKEREWWCHYIPKRFNSQHTRHCVSYRHCTMVTETLN
jgi:hypothetical protein